MPYRTLNILCRYIRGPMTIKACQDILWSLSPRSYVGWYPEYLLLSSGDYTELCRRFSQKTPDILNMSSEAFMRYLEHPWEEETPLRRIASITHTYDGRQIPIASLPGLPREPRWSEVHWTFEQRGYPAFPTATRGQVYILCDTE